jgi:primosomal replication protein N
VPTNQIVVDGKIIAIDALRFTPAGIPALNFSLGHKSRQEEADTWREVECEIAVLALGEVARQASLQVGDSLLVNGFLAKKSRNSTTLVLHANKIESTQI